MTTRYLTISDLAEKVAQCVPGEARATVDQLVQAEIDSGEKAAADFDQVLQTVPGQHRQLLSSYYKHHPFRARAPHKIVVPI